MKNPIATEQKILGILTRCSGLAVKIWFTEPDEDGRTHLVADKVTLVRKLVSEKSFDTSQTENWCRFIKIGDLIIWDVSKGFINIPAIAKIEVLLEE